MLREFVEVGESPLGIYPVVVGIKPPPRNTGFRANQREMHIDWADQPSIVRAAFSTTSSDRTHEAPNFPSRVYRGTTIVAEYEVSI